MYITGLIIAIYIFVSLEEGIITIDDITNFNNQLSNSSDFKNFDTIKLVPDDYRVLRKNFVYFIDKYVRCSVHGVSTSASSRLN